ncbi:DNA topoisomerase 2 [Basidiobolus ranarum]|uniref:DNA topoisomerase 2 n=1 Tax=Basidiobolus ranarum TaxID=34480 RepID=A0ABR2WW28_9FUNG
MKSESKGSILELLQSKNKPKDKAVEPTESKPTILPESSKTEDVPKEKSLEEIYQKKTQLEHILLRPDTYIGSAEVAEMDLWVYDSKAECMVFKKTNIVPGFYKIFDEILVNAADNKIRDPTMNTIKVTIDRENNLISVYNNGSGIPIEMHKKEKVFIPELIFGHLLTSSNYDDKEKKVTGGRNGYGAKLCNIYSTQFIVETGNKQTGQKYKQVFSNNMAKIGKPSITKSNKTDFTKITFKPDFEKFGMSEIDDDHECLLKKRVFDIAGCLRGGVKVYLNSKLIPIKNFKDYVKLYLKGLGGTEEGEASPPQIVYEKIKGDGDDDRWEVCFTQSEGQFQQVSFVNNISTIKGGTHVQCIADQIINKLADHVKSKNKGAPVKKFQIKNQCWVFINCLIENPAFDSQTKENLTLRPSSFGSKPTLSTGFLNRITSQTKVVDNIMDFARVKEAKMMKKTDGQKRSRLVGISKLDDANMAGTKKGRDCTLILTEGDSAKTLAVSGLSVVGRDSYGVFPLRGKLLNVREASHKQIYDNAEINNVKKILGLQHGVEYNSTESLRYGHLMIMTDQDHDGSHIKGLIINFLDHFWPSLLKVPGFLVEFITPIVRVKKNKSDISFFTIPEYEDWKANNNNGAGWHIKYYKGLGTSTAVDAKNYFSSLDYHCKEFAKAKPEDRVLIDMAFNKKKADERKEWLRSFQIGTYMDHSVNRIEISNFINRELILFSIADNIRSIPSLVDGLKPGHRKILFGCFKRNLKGEIKVQQLAGYVSEHSAYHHGEQSLCATIVGLAQDFVGSNNLNLLEPIGMFGTRILGGKDAASPRYIFTSLTNLTRRIFHPDDEHLLTYLTDDGQKVEPQWYMPILPLLLVNGGEGIGTGWSSMIPNYNPLDIVENLKRKMRGEELVKMIPWYRGFKGTIVPISSDKYQVSGIITKIDDTTIDVTELPIRSWTQTYKDFLESLLVEKENVVPFIKDYKEYHTHTSVHFRIELSEEKMKEAEAEGLEKKFKIINYISTSNMVCFDKNLQIKKYQSPEAILEDFFEVRLGFYHDRKEWLLNQLNSKKEELENRARFILEIIDRTLIVQNKKKLEILKDLKERGYKTIGQIKKGILNSETEAETEADDGEATGYNYLLGMPIWNLTKEKVDQLQEEIAKKNQEIEELMEKTPISLWETDLDDFLAEWMISLEEFQLAMESNSDIKKSKGRNNKKPTKRTPKPKALNSSTLKNKRKLEDGADSTDDFQSDGGARDVKPRATPTRAARNKPNQRIVDSDENDLDESEKESTLKSEHATPPLDVVEKKETSEAPTIAKMKQRKVTDMLTKKALPEPTVVIKVENSPPRTSEKLQIPSEDVKVEIKAEATVLVPETQPSKSKEVDIFDFPSSSHDSVRTSPISKSPTTYKARRRTVTKQSTLNDKIQDNENPQSDLANDSEAPTEALKTSPPAKRQRTAYSTPRRQNKASTADDSSPTTSEQTSTRTSTRARRKINFSGLDADSSNNDESDVSEFEG